MPRLTLLLAALAALLLLPAAAPAAPPWSAPTTVAEGSPFSSSSPAVLYRPAGAGSVLWRASSGLFAAPLGAGGQPLEGRRVGAGGNGVAFPAFAAGRRFVIARVRYPSDGPPVLAAGAADAPGERFAFQRLYVLRGYGVLLAAVADADRAGAVAFGTRPGSAVRRGRVFLAVRAGTSKRYRAPVAVSPRGAVHAVAVAANARGDVLAAWERSRRVEGRLRYASGRLGPVLRLGRVRSRARRIDVALADDRRAVVAWLDQTMMEGEATSRARIQAAVRGPRSPFGPAKLLEEFPDREIAGGTGVEAAIAGNWGMVAWTGRRAVRASIATGGTFDAPQDLGPLPDDAYDLGGGLFGLDATPAGKALAVWVDPAAAPSSATVRAATLSGTAGPAFGPAETVSAPGAAMAMPAGALHPLDSTAVVAWVEVPRGDPGNPRIAVASRPAP
jgi:hypothetical protein